MSTLFKICIKFRASQITSKFWDMLIKYITRIFFWQIFFYSGFSFRIFVFIRICQEDLPELFYRCVFQKDFSGRFLRRILDPPTGQKGSYLLYQIRQWWSHIPPCRIGSQFMRILENVSSLIRPWYLAGPKSWVVFPPFCKLNW